SCVLFVWLTRPLVHIAAHVPDAAGRAAVRVHVYGRALAQAALLGVGAPRLEGAAPGVVDGVVGGRRVPAARSSFPFGLGGQAHGFASSDDLLASPLFGKPVAVGLGFVPAHTDDGLRAAIEILVIPVARLGPAILPALLAPPGRAGAVRRAVA